MKQSWMNNKWFLPLVFSLYETLLMWFFGLPEFVGPIIPSLQLLFGLLILLMLVFRITEFVLLKYIETPTVAKIITTLSTVVLVSVTGWLILSIDTAYTLSYFSGFLLSAVVFAVFYYLLILLREMPAGLTLNKSDSGETTSAAAVLSIDHKGRSRLELPLDTVVCFEASDNYVTIHYLTTDGKPSRRLERLSMRKVEELLAGAEEQFIRVHKSYLINKQFVAEITGKSQAYRIRLHHLEEQIPVSRKINIREKLPNH